MKSVVLLLLTSALVGLIKSSEWDGLRVKWDKNIFSSYTYASMPRTVADAISEGFTKIDDCNPNAAWRGARYIKNNDHALCLLYDVNGYIAGIQTGVPKNQNNSYPNPTLRPPFVDDGERWVVTAYFTDPSKICTTGRSASQFQIEGTGTNLYIQNGSLPGGVILIPKNEDDIKGTKWTEGECFYTMGKHYWYDLHDDMSCGSIFPAFLLYNSGELNGFGWAMTTYIVSDRYEHPPPASYSWFMNPPPKCLDTAGTMTTQHIYLQDSIFNLLC